MAAKMLKNGLRCAENITFLLFDLEYQVTLLLRWYFMSAAISDVIFAIGGHRLKMAAEMLNNGLPCTENITF